MTAFGYTMMCGQSPPDLLVRDIEGDERAGFELSMISDRFQLRAPRMRRSRSERKRRSRSSPGPNSRCSRR